MRPLQFDEVRDANPERWRRLVTEAEAAGERDPVEPWPHWFMSQLNAAFELGRADGRQERLGRRSASS